MMRPTHPQNILRKGLIFFLGITLIVLIKYAETALILQFFNPVSNYSMIIACLIPIALIAWYVGGTIAVLTALLTGIAWITIDLHVGETSPVPRNFRYIANTVDTVVLVLFAIVINALRRALDLTRELAQRDDLTDALNMRAFVERATTEISRTRRYSRSFTVATIDINQFREFLDRFGSKVGNELVKTMALQIPETIRSVDVLARVGTDTFCVLLPETGYDQAQIVLPRIQQRLQEKVQQCNWPATFSISAISWSKAPESVEDALEQLRKELGNSKSEAANVLKHKEVSKVQAA